MKTSEFITALLIGALIGASLALLLFAWCAPVYCAEPAPRVITGPGTVRLVWSPNTESDLDHYTAYWYRADSAGILGTVAAPDTTATFALPMRRFYERYSFTLTATDRASNESLPSASIEAIFSRQPVLYGDVNADGMVDVEDGELIRASYGALPWYAAWRERADLDGSGRIDIEDGEIVRTQYGKR